MSLLTDVTLKSLGDSILNAASDLLENSDFLSRTIGMTNTYEDIMFIVQALGREPISLLGKDYAFIYDHVRRNYMEGTYENNKSYNGCHKFTFYKEVPTVRFANPYTDPMNVNGWERWVSNLKTQYTKNYNVTYSYSESNDKYNTNRQIGAESDLKYANPGVANGSIESFGANIQTCDLVGKTNQNFRDGKYQTLIARFHSNSEESKSQTDPTQSANSKEYGLSHGRNLISLITTYHHGYDNPYCRAWTYQHQYNQIARQIRPFLDWKGNALTADGLEQEEYDGNGHYTVGFRRNRTGFDKDTSFEGGSKRLDDYGVLNYRNGTVNIAPTAKLVDYSEGKENEYEQQKISTKKCMFSIENLAWRDSKMVKSDYDVNGLSPEQKGPLGGRIMWFPPYDLKFSEGVNVKWNQNEFIGRGENIYTYTNTERTGTLSFTLIIDHPSVLDYWNRDGLDKGNSGGVDNLNNEENTLLRFFAGCEILTAKPQTYKNKTVKPKDGEKDTKKKKKDNPGSVDDPNERPKKKIVAILYFPNNYSGVDDRAKDSIVNPVYYLMNGIGTQKGTNWIHGLGNEKHMLAKDYPADIRYPVVCDEYPYYEGNEDTILNKFGGYEMQTINGISIVPWDDYYLAFEVSDASEAYDIIEKTYVKPYPEEEDKNHIKGQYLTKSDGDCLHAYYKGQYDEYENNLIPTKIVGDKATSLDTINLDVVGARNAIKNLTGKTHTWYQRRYYYRVDKGKENDVFYDPMSYIDSISFGLNSFGYDIRGIYDESGSASALMNKFGLKEDSDDFKLISFSELFLALEGRENNVVNKFAKEEDLNENNIKLAYDILTNRNKYKNVKVHYIGHASAQGDVASNNVLARERALTLKYWLEDFGVYNIFKDVTFFGDVKVVNQGNKKTTKKNVGGANDYISKIWRSASVEIEYDEVSEEDAATAELPTAMLGIDGKAVKDLDGNAVTKESVSVKNKETSTNNATKIYEILHNTPIGRSILQSHPELGYEGMMSSLTFEEIERRTGVNLANINIDNSETSDNSNKKRKEITDVVRRYDNEGEFFKALDKNSPFLHHLISEKIKYFDPAFHSISPEGFNARLTFLQQCTRQGPTVENSAFESSTAYNLAFGRPPVCVLRVGDFYNTKVIITGMDINYETPQWDMNPEGIGMMPMFANVSLKFVFLGGSDLSGPVSRLQNAVSFNYYANTSVYDDRAEMVEYDKDGSGKETKFQGFIYPKVSNDNK